MSEESRTAMKQWIEMWNSGDFATWSDRLAPDLLVHSEAHLPADIKGLNQFKAVFDGLRQAFPDARFTVEDELSVGDRNFHRWVMRATHKGEYLGFAPSGREVTIDGVTILRLADGKIAEYWAVADWRTLGQSG